MLAAQVAWAASGRAQLLSLFPERSPRDLQAELDGLSGAPPRLAVGQWRPYGLPVRVDELELGVAPGGLRTRFTLGRQDWGPIAAWRLGASVRRSLGEGLLLGLAWSGERLDAGQTTAGLWLQAALGRRPVFVLSTRLAGEPGSGRAARAPGAQLGLGLAEGAWVLRLWRQTGGPAGAEDGLALERRLGPCALGLSATWPGWQGVALRYDGSRWGLALEERFHAELGSSHGLRLMLSR